MFEVCLRFGPFCPQFLNFFVQSTPLILLKPLKSNNLKLKKFIWKQPSTNKLSA